MKYIKCLKYDLCQGILFKAVWWLPWIVLIVLFCIDYDYQAANISGYLGLESERCMADYLCYILAGMKAYTPLRDIPFQFPEIWVLIYSYVLMSVLKYPYDNLYTHGTQILIRVKCRGIWWLSKCTYVIIKCIGMFLILYLTISIYCVCRGGNLAGIPDYILMLEISDYMQPMEEWSAQVCTGLFILPAMTAVCIGLMQLLLSLITRPVYAFIGAMVIIIASAYLQSAFLPGSGAMFIRNSAVNPEGMNVSGCLVIAAAYSIICIFVGFVVFKRWDILKKED